MRVELVAVGTELLLGDIVNGNAAWLGQRLAEAGVDVAHSTVVGDNIERIADVLRLGLSRADAVVVTGGIGPTQDDLTREALAAVAGVPLVRDAGLESALRDRFTALRRDVPEMNYRQADVPHEMEAMFAESVLPDLLTRAGEPAVIVNRVLRTAGMWESAVAAALGPLVERLAEQGNPTIAFLASAGQTRVRITAKAATYDDALAMVAPVEQEARAALGSGVYGTDDDTLDAVVIGLLRSRGETVAVAESLTGGLLGGLLTAGRGASDGFAGGVIAYSNDAKAALLGVGDDLLAAEGAVSAAVAAAMAAGVRARLRTTYGVALTGVAGPDGQDGQPVGTVFAGLATPDGVDTTQLRLPGDRARIRQYAAVAAVNLLRLHLVGAPAR